MRTFNVFGEIERRRQSAFGGAAALEADLYLTRSFSVGLAAQIAFYRRVHIPEHGLMDRYGTRPLKTVAASTHLVRLTQLALGARLHL